MVEVCLLIMRGGSRHNLWQTTVIGEAMEWVLVGDLWLRTALFSGVGLAVSLRTVHALHVRIHDKREKKGGEKLSLFSFL